MSEDKIHDLLGLAPISRAVERVTDSTLSGIEALLSRICLPAAEEFGLALRDRVGHWRLRNAAATVAKAAPMLNAAAEEGRTAPPRVVMESLQHASWTDNDDVQQMWAGLLASSCTTGGRDDSNWIFVNLLGQLTEMQASILKFAGEATTKDDADGLIEAKYLYRTRKELMLLTNCTELHRLDRELDHLRALGLIHAGLQKGVAEGVDLTPSALGLHLYVRAQGSLLDPVDFFGVRRPT